MTPADAPAVHLSGLRLDRGGRTILRGIDMTVPRGSITAVLGPSGSGKSTLLAALTGELPPAAGTVEVFGQPVPHGSRALLEMRKGIGVLLQGNGLLTDLTTAENVALPLRTHTKLPEALIRRLVDLKLNAVGLRAAADAYPRELSGGMRKRAALAQLLVYEPDTLLLDEPFGALDAQLKLVLAQELATLHARTGQTVLFVTHDLGEAIALADRVVVFSGRPGRIKAIERVALPRPRDMFRARFEPAFQELYERLWAALAPEIGAAA